MLMQHLLPSRLLAMSDTLDARYPLEYTPNVQPENVTNDQTQQRLSQAWRWKPGCA